MMQLKNLLAVLLLLCATVFVACKNDDPAPVEQSPYVGVWRGITSQGDSLKFTIADVQGKAMLTEYDVNVRINLNGNELTTNQKGTNANGYAGVMGNKVNFRIEPIDVAATFTSSATMEGTYQGEMSIPNPIKIEGTFTAVK